MARNNFYTSVAQHGNRILIREMVDGVERRREEEWSPSLFVKCKAAEKEYTSLFGDPVKKLHLDNISEAKDLVARYKDVDGFEVFGQQNWILQYIHGYQMGTPVFSDISVRCIDIETEVPDSGFPKPAKAEARVVLITCTDKYKTPVTFGLKPYDGTDTKYHYCEDEPTLFRKFLEWWETNFPSVVTGWNVDGFDIPYLVVRISSILGKSQVNRLSPWGIVRWQPSRLDAEKIDVDILGVAILDYMNLMKKYTYGQRPSWSLGAVGAEEVGHTKVDHSEYSSFNEFMEKDWNKFVRYNIVDTLLVLKIDEKMQLLDLAFTVAYTAKINYPDIHSPVKTWDAIIHNALMDKGIVVPQRKSTGFSDGSIEGGFVKTPIPGLYRFIASIDATSLYPSIMQTLNLSPETFVGMTDSSVDACLAGLWPDLSDGIACGANGAMFAKNKRGIIPELIDSFMAMRKKSKGEMLALKSEYEKTKDETLKSKIAALDNQQMASKILMNSLYGAIANNGFRFFNPNVAEAITTTGQLYLRSIDKKLPALMEASFKIPKKDYVTYADTDSVYISMEEIVNKYIDLSSPIEKVVKAIELTVQKKIQPLVGSITDEVSDKLSVFDRKISFKLEIVADKAIFCAKKKYACRVFSSEGVTYAEPELKVMGLEMVRSSTPVWVRDKLEEAFNLIFSSDEKTVQAYIQKVKAEFFKQPPEVIARPTGVNEMTKHQNKSTIYAEKNVPIHVRAALLYNHYLHKYNLQARAHTIQDSDKIKYVYLKMPNTIKENVIAWPVDEELPAEFKLHKYVDYDVQFDKTFLSAISIVLTAIKWSPVEIATLDDFFS